MMHGQQNIKYKTITQLTVIQSW